MSEKRNTVSAAMRLLRAVAGELRDLATDTARFGETLSDHRGANSHASIRMLQKFDLFAQSLQAHAVLIDNISTRLDSGTIDGEQLDELLRHVPFFSVRERLRAVVNGVDAAPEAEESPDDWFLGE
jgi:hypothetical protein